MHRVDYGTRVYVATQIDYNIFNLRHGKQITSAGILMAAG